MLVSISYGQTITKELKIVSKDYEIEVLKTQLSEIRQIFKKDSIVEVEFDGTYIFKNKQLVYFICDKNEDSIIDIVGIYLKEIKTWNNLFIGLPFKTVKEKLPVGEYGVNYDFANKICYSYSPYGERKVNMTFYLGTGQTEPYSDELTQKEYESILLKGSTVDYIEIYNPE